MVPSQHAVLFDIILRVVSSAYQNGMHYLRYQLGCHSCMVAMVVTRRREFWVVANADCWGRKGRVLLGWVVIWGTPEGSIHCRVL